MIIVTGAAGFIGSCLVGYLNQQGYDDIILVDDFQREDKRPNYQNKRFLEKIDRKDFFRWINGKGNYIQAIFHLGARTDTTEKNEDIFEDLNLRFSQKLWNICTTFQIPFIYASSAATYGDGSLGFDDDPELLPHLKPLNPYARSKHAFDLWVMEQIQKERYPFFWVGLKFFNVYGPNEWHKGRMASVVYHAYRQIQKEGKVRLFKSYKPEYAHGEQKRDFIYVMDVVKVLYYLWMEKPSCGIYNLGTGKSRTFNDLIAALFKALSLPTEIEYIEMPDDIKNSYQYFTEANMERFRRETGYELPFMSVEEGVAHYVEHFLVPQRYF